MFLFIPEGLTLERVFNNFMRTYDTMSEAISALKKRGYNHDFNLHPEWIECLPLQLVLGPAEFHVDEVHRFEANTDPDDSAVLYAISSPTGAKGIIIDAYGAYAESLSPIMIAKLKIDYRTEH